MAHLKYGSFASKVGRSNDRRVEVNSWDIQEYVDYVD